MMRIMGMSAAKTSSYGDGSVRRPRPSRSLAPREHGAYGQITLPLAAALAGGRPGIGAFCLGGAGLLVFFAHEPLLVAIGLRGTRALREDGPRAKRRLVELGAGAALLGGVGLLSAPGAAPFVLLPIALGLVVGAFIREEAEKTAAGELIAAAALSSLGLPVAVASGTPVATALWTWLAWYVGFGSATMAVRTVVASMRERIPLLRRVGAPIAFGAMSAALVAYGLIPAFIWLAFVPTWALALGLAARPPSARHLRRIGWMIVAATTFAALALAAGSRSESPTPPGPAANVYLPRSR
jgi:hypothetical protein